MFVKSFVKAKLLLEEFKNDERGVTAIEYAVIGAAIAGVLVTIMGSADGSFLDSLSDQFGQITTSLTSDD